MTDLLRLPTPLVLVRTLGLTLLGTFVAFVALGHREHPEDRASPEQIGAGVRRDFTVAILGALVGGGLAFACSRVEAEYGNEEDVHDSPPGVPRIPDGG